MLISTIIPTFQEPTQTLALVQLLRGQIIPAGHDLEIIVVDDGSGEEAQKQLSSGLEDIGIFIPLLRNRGRASARSRGVAEAQGDVLLLIDCDCLPAGPDLVQSHLKALEPGVIASIGAIEGDGRGFWHRYQTEASSRRLRQLTSGMSYSGSSANMMIRRTAFDEAGGFSNVYEGYGFEDRDLLLRLAHLGGVAFTSDAIVRHMDRLTLANVCRKLDEAGRLTSTIFLSKHPEAYRALGYASIDARLHPVLKPLAWLSGPLIRPLGSILDPLLEGLPYPIAKAVVKLVSACAYLCGTYRASRPSP